MLIDNNKVISIDILYHRNDRDYYDCYFLYIFLIKTKVAFFNYFRYLINLNNVTSYL